MYTILIIEKNFSSLEILGEWLISLGTFPLKASTLQEGYKWLELEHPDLILCSYLFYDGNGLEFLQKIRQRLDTQDTPFILITGSRFKPIEDGRFNFLPNAIFYKSFSPQMLLESLKVYLPLLSDVNLK